MQVILAIALAAGPFYLRQHQGGAVVPNPSRLAFQKRVGTGLHEINPTTSWPISTVSAPDDIWFGVDPTGASSISTRAYTAGGTPATSIDTPFCPSGDWSNSSNCMQAVRFDGSTDYYDADAEWGDPGTGDFTVCAIARTSTAIAAAGAYASKRSAGTGYGWILYASNTGNTCNFVAQGASASSGVLSVAPTVAHGQWLMCCGVIDADGNKWAWANGTASGTSAAALGTIDPSEVVSIGSQYATHANKFPGDILTVFTKAAALTDGELDDIYEYFFGLTDNAGATPTFSNTGPTCCWNSDSTQKIECFSDNAPRFGCSPPPGTTGAGNNDDCQFHGIATGTNSAVYSRVLDTGWAATATVAAATNTPFMDGRTVYSIEDDDGAASERLYQNIDISALNTGDKIAVCTYYATDSGTESLDYWGYESTVCGSPTIPEFDALTATTSWQMAAQVITVADGTCTTLQHNYSPVTNHNTASLTGGPVNLISMVFLNQDYCPSTYSETAAAGVASGADDLSYAPTRFVDASGNLNGRFTMSLDWTPFVAQLPATNVMMSLSDSSVSDLHYFASNTSEIVYLYGGASGGAGGQTMVQTGALTMTPGTSKHLVGQSDYNADFHQLWIDGTSIGTYSTAKTSPTGVNRLAIGAYYNASYQSGMGACYNNVEVRQ